MLNLMTLHSGICHKKKRGSVPHCLPAASRRTHVCDLTWKAKGEAFTFPCTANTAAPKTSQLPDLHGWTPAGQATSGNQHHTSAELQYWQQRHKHDKQPAEIKHAIGKESAEPQSKASFAQVGIFENVCPAGEISDVRLTTCQVDSRLAETLPVHVTGLAREQNQLW